MQGYKNSLFNKLLSLVLAVAFSVGMIPQIAFTSYAEPIEDDSIVPEALLKGDAPACEEKERPHVRTATLEQLRPLLAEKARAGYKAEIFKEPCYLR